MATYSPTDSGSNTPLSPVENFESNLEKKLLAVTSRQDSIQTLSLWLIHHKSQCQKVTHVWFKVLKKAKIPHRLTMFYLANDVLQNCKRKNAKIYLLAFKSVLKEAIVYVRDPSIRGSLERMLNIWDERNVYKGAFVEELKELLVNSKKRTSANSKIIAEFKPAKLIESINNFKRFESEVELKQKQLSNLRLDASDLEAVRQLKDKAHGHEFSKHFEESCTKIESFVENLHKQVKDQTKLIELLEKSELFYEAQYGEARIVANAYKNFGTRIHNLQKRLEEHKKTLPSPFNSPCVSPSMDAPSPGNTPPPDPTLDNVEAVDMELSDSEGSEAAAITTAKPTVKSSVKIVQKPQEAMEESKESRRKSKERESSHKRRRPSSSSSSKSHKHKESRVKSKSGSNHGHHHSSKNHSSSRHSRSSESSRESSAQKEVDMPVYVPPPVKRHAKPESTVDNGSGTPVKDESGGTPTQDELPDTSNPIDFLTKLINKTQKSGSVNSSNLLENLSLLTNSVQLQKAKQESKPPEKPLTWAEMKKREGGENISPSPSPSTTQQPPVSAPMTQPGTAQHTTAPSQPVTTSVAAPEPTYQPGHAPVPTSPGFAPPPAQTYAPNPYQPPPQTPPTHYQPPHESPPVQAVPPSYIPGVQSPPIPAGQPAYPTPPTPPVQSQPGYHPQMGGQMPGFNQAQPPPGFQPQPPPQVSQPYAPSSLPSTMYSPAQPLPPAQPTGQSPYIMQQGSAGYPPPPQPQPGMQFNVSVASSQPYQQVVTTTPSYQPHQPPTPPLQTIQQPFQQGIPVSQPYQPNSVHTPTQPYQPTPPANVPTGHGYQAGNQQQQLNTSGGFQPPYPGSFQPPPSSPQPQLHQSHSAPQFPSAGMSQPPQNFGGNQSGAGNRPPPPNFGGQQGMPPRGAPTMNRPPQMHTPRSPVVSSPAPPSLPPPPLRGILRNRSNSNNVEIKTMTEESGSNTNLQTIPTIGGSSSLNKQQIGSVPTVTSTNNRPKIIRPPPTPPTGVLKTLSAPTPATDGSNNEFIDKLKQRSNSDNLPKPPNPNLKVVSSGGGSGGQSQQNAPPGGQNPTEMEEGELGSAEGDSETMGSRIGIVTHSGGRHQNRNEFSDKFNPQEFRGPRAPPPRHGGPPRWPVGPSNRQMEPPFRHRPPFRGNRPPPPGGYFDRRPRPYYSPNY